MDNSVFGIMDLLVAACGGYVIYQYIMMITTKTLRQNMLVSKDINIKKCKDVQGYIKDVSLPQIVFGLVSFGCGAIGLVQDFVTPVPTALYLGAMGVFILAAIWYCAVLRKAQKRYW